MNSEASALTTKSKMNGTIDIVKVIMAVLVIGIHTEPFGFNVWLDRGFGIITRLCVPFFFVASAYFFWRKDKPAKLFLKRIATLYVVWSIIFIPYDINKLKEMTVPEILYRYFWIGNEHGLWYLYATIIGFIITYILLKFLKPKYVLIIAIVLLVIGTAKSTYSAAFQQLFGFTLPDVLKSRNGLFYGFPYIALGMSIAKSKTQGIIESKKKVIIGFIISLLFLVLESYLFVVRFKAESTILWLSVFPCIYFFFLIVKNINISISANISLTLRKMSTLLYFSQFLFIPLLHNYLSNITFFIAVTALSAIFSIAVIKISEIKYFRFLKILY